MAGQVPFNLNRRPVDASGRFLERPQNLDEVRPADAKRGRTRRQVEDALERRKLARALEEVDQ